MSPLGDKGEYTRLSSSLLRHSPAPSARPPSSLFTFLFSLRAQRAPPLLSSLVSRHFSGGAGALPHHTSYFLLLNFLLAPPGAPPLFLLPVLLCFPAS